MATFDNSDLPALSRLWKGVGIALVIAGVVLLVAVLPAEYGIDPTGIGRKIGLERRAVTAVPATTPVVAPSAGSADPAQAAPAASVSVSAETFRSDEMTLTLAPGEGAEIKALMQKGKQFVFSWVAKNGMLELDMHGEPINARGNEFTSYWKETSRADGHGTFSAPFDGTHGWYWRNGQAQPVTVTLRISGFYEKLFQPK